MHSIYTQNIRNLKTKGAFLMKLFASLASILLLSNPTTLPHEILTSDSVPSQQPDKHLIIECPSWIPPWLCS